MSTPLEDAVEKYFVELLKTSSVLSALSIKQFATDEAADSPGIVVEATQKEHCLDGPRGFRVEVRILWRGTVTNEDDSNEISEAIVATIVNAAPGATAAENNFTYLNIFDEEMDGERSNTKDLRKRQRIVQVRAKIPA